MHTRFAPDKRTQQQVKLLELDLKDPDMIIRGNALTSLGNLIKEEKLTKTLVSKDLVEGVVFDITNKDRDWDFEAANVFSSLAKQDLLDEASSKIASEKLMQGLSAAPISKYLFKCLNDLAGKSLFESKHVKGFINYLEGNMGIYDSVTGDHALSLFSKLVETKVLKMDDISGTLPSEFTRSLYDKDEHHRKRSAAFLRITFTILPEAKIRGILAEIAAKSLEYDTYTAGPALELFVNSVEAHPIEAGKADELVQAILPKLKPDDWYNAFKVLEPLVKANLIGEARCPALVQTLASGFTIDSSRRYKYSGMLLELARKGMIKQDYMPETLIRDVMNSALHSGGDDAGYTYVRENCVQLIALLARDGLVGKAERDEIVNGCVERAKINEKDLRNFVQEGVYDFLKSAFPEKMSARAARNIAEKAEIQELNIAINGSISVLREMNKLGLLTQDEIKRTGLPSQYWS